MSAVFLKVLNMSITASWLILAAIVLRLLLKKAPKWISCLLWALVAVRLICPFSFESVLSLVPAKEPVPTDIMLSQKPTVETAVPVIDNAVNTVIADNFTPAPTDSANPLQIVIPILAVVWIVGVVALLAYAFFSWLKLKKTVSASFPVEEGVKSCDDVKAPFILGVFKPVIYLPSSMSEGTLDYVLRHERAHLARHDHWWKPLGFLLLAVYWFNPLSWVAYMLLCRDIESACDEKVIRDMDKGSMAAYSQALLDCSFSRRAIAACPLAFGEVGVKERIKGVLNYRKPAFWIIIVALVACVVVGICFLTNPRDEEPDLSFLNYKNAISTVIDSTEIWAVSHTDSSTSITLPDYAINGAEFARFLDEASWKEIKALKEDINSSNSVEFHISAEYMLTIYENPRCAKIQFQAEERFYKTGPDDYQKALDLYNNSAPAPVSFTATVTEISNGSVYVTPSEGSSELLSSDSFTIPLSDDTGKIFRDYIPAVGDIVEITHDDYVYAIYPAAFRTIYSVKLVARNTNLNDVSTYVTYVGWNDDRIVWDEALNKGDAVLSSAIYLPTYKLESVEDLDAFEKKFENTMDLGLWYDNSIRPFNVRALDYDEEFFIDNAVIIAYMSAGSGSFRYDIKNVTIEGTTLCLNVEQTVRPDVYTDDMAGWLFLATVPKSSLANIEKYTAKYVGESENLEASAFQTPTYELQDFETESIISTFDNYDLTHDGINDIVQVSYITTDGFDGTFTEQTFHNGAFGFIKVFDGAKGTAQNSPPIYEHDYGKAHVGNGAFFITTVDGKDYLVESSIWSGQGESAYYYNVLSFENGGTQVADEDEVTFEYGTKHAADEFFDNLHKWINDDSALLMAIDVDLDFTFYSTKDNIVNPDEYYHRKISEF